MDDNCIGCDKCPLWLHDSPLCMGLSQSIIQSLKEGGDALLFVCTGCRVGNSGGASGVGGGGRCTGDSGSNNLALSSSMRLLGPFVLLLRLYLSRLLS